MHLKQVLYRLKQFFRALRANLSEEELQIVHAELTLAECRLFERMPAFDQRHALDVYQVLRCAHEQNEHILKAALLHDCGKVDDQGRPIPLLYYGMFVILEQFAPALYQRAARHERGPLWPFSIHQVHELRSAQLVEQANGSAALVTILYDYANGKQTDATLVLAQADDLC